jgi:peptidoglycan/LPS O-acetylase OafA/YrhL
VVSVPRTASPDYRPDIDGLRAVAVASVLLFHAFPSRLPGGFIGVDIFFVISGFLISGIIFRANARERFSFVEFYSHRVRRIFPALLLVCAVCLLFGWVVLIPPQFRRLGVHVLGGAAFSSNFILLGESGYFDVDSAVKPLRHLWSLAIEEQYYLVWPALLFLFRRRQSATWLLLLALGLVSFGCNLYLTSTDRSMAYYLPLTRIWELMIGGGLALVTQHRTIGAQQPVGLAGSPSPQSTTAGSTRGLLADIQSASGTVAIILSLFLINEKRAFPGWWALLACAGATLLIAAGQQAWINRRILSSRLFVWVGLISYPLYLWHWPLLSFGNIMSGKPSAAFRAGALVASVVLAWLTYKFVELPVRTGKTAPQLRRVTLHLVQLMVLVGLIAVLAGHEIIPSASAADPGIANISQASSDWESIDNETVPGTVKGTVLFFGDSHMEQYWPRVEMLTRHNQSRRTVEFRTMGGCAPLPGIERRNKQCTQFVSSGYLRASQPDVEIVVLAAQWSGLTSYADYYQPDAPGSPTLNFLAPESAWVFDRFSDTLARLHRLGKRVVVLLSSPHGGAFDPQSMVDYHELIPRARQVSGVARADLASAFSPIDSRVRVAAEKGGAQVLEPLDWFCNGSVCPVQDSRGRPVSKDGSHMCASVVRTRAVALDQFVLLSPLAAVPDRPPALPVAALLRHQGPQPGWSLASPVLSATEAHLTVAP